MQPYFVYIIWSPGRLNEKDKKTGDMLTPIGQMHAASSKTSSDEEDYEPPRGAGPWPTYGPGRCCPLNIDRMLRPCDCRASHYACRHSRACSCNGCEFLYRRPKTVGCVNII
jgi:hypothetical protein